MTAMIYVYVRLVELGSRTIETVPEHLREEVAKLLAERAAEAGGS